jgi:hypothetical protein
MAYIEPVSLPSAAGQSYGDGDVRHFSEGDALGVPALANPTRQLAARDTILAEKLNLALLEINNKEQIIPLPIYRMVVPPSSEEIVANHRIPSGYEARVLNAAISSSPSSSDIELDIMWSEGFGNVSGVSVMTTTSESSGGTTFSPAGEFIVKIKNRGGITLDAVASIMVTMRPITDTAGALLPAATVAPAGPAGPAGGKGDKGGEGGVGPAGTPGLNWRGAWVKDTAPITYSQAGAGAAADVVTHDFAGTSGASSFVCVQTHIATVANQPQPSLTPSPFWSFLAEAGAEGPGGGSGTNSVTAYDTNTITSALTTQGDFVSGVSHGGYDGGGDPSQTYTQAFIESTSSADGHGLAVLTASVRRIFFGSVVLTLPQKTDGAAVNWATDTVHLIVTGNGTSSGTVSSWAKSSTEYEINAAGPAVQKVAALLTGSATY